MSYNPKIHHRKSIRLKGYDYSQAGAYFITGCWQHNKCWFGKIENGEMILNAYGIIAYNEWLELSERFANFKLDTFQIMPNHIHGIIVLNEVGATLAVAQGGTPSLENIYVAPPSILDVNGVPLSTPDKKKSETDLQANRATARVAPTTISTAPITATTKSMSDIIGAYKSLVANKCLETFKAKHSLEKPEPLMGKLWQRNFYEHIIRNEKSYQTISNYIINNPANWNNDKFYENIN